MADTKAPGLEARLPMLRGVPGLAEKLRPVAALIELRREPVWVMLPYAIKID
jgi:hypothetical protein